MATTTNISNSYVINYVNIVEINVFNNNVKIVKVSDNVQQDVENLEGVLVTFSSEWDSYDKVAMITCEGETEMIRQEQWIDNIVEIPKRLLELKKSIEVKFLGFQTSRNKFSNSIVINKY